MLKRSDDGKVRVLSLSYGKDSIATIRACELLGYPLDRIVTADVWATQDIPADLPPMWEFKKKADEIIFDRWGIKVEHLCAMQKGDSRRERLSYNDYFYGKRQKGKRSGQTIGFPMQRKPWCNKLKTEKIDILGYISAGADKNSVIQYLGIAADEPLRIARHIVRPNIVLPLVDIGADEALCGLEAKYMGLLAPTYETGTRDGCWFCHNQGVAQLRNLRKNYPDLWALLMKWDTDSPVSFHADGHTVHDFDERFAAEDRGEIMPDELFRWSMLDCLQMRLF